MKIVFHLLLYDQKTLPCISSCKKADDPETEEPETEAPESRKKMANATDGVSFYVGGGHKANQSLGKPDKKFRERH